MIPQGPGSFSTLDWTAICRRIVEAQRAIFDEHRGIAARTVYEGQGEGGDWALVIDRLCETAVFEELEALAKQGHSFTAISEERGQVSYGDDGAPARVVIDPIDGSLNARRTIPSHCLSLAVGGRASMADVEFGYVYDFGAGEEFWARRGEGAWLDGVDLGPPGGGLGEAADARLEVVGLEGMEPSRILPAIERLRDRVYRFRAVGAIAISLGYVAAGRFDGMLTARACRSVDAAAGQLIARESGAKVAFGDLPLEQLPMDLDARYMLASARSDEGLRSLLDAQSAIPA